MRKPGSARFEPYFKVQWWDARSLAWVDVQQAFPSIREARAAALEGASPGRQYRVMEVREGGRWPVFEART
jgi:hypothetical protein